jgi:hypothetical protein
MSPSIVQNPNFAIYLIATSIPKIALQLNLLQTEFSDQKQCIQDTMMVCD